MAQGEPRDLQFQVTPYVWMAGMGGTLRPVAGGPTVEMDKSFFDVLHDLDGAAFVSGIARRDRLILLGDFSYSRSSKQGDIASGVQAKGSERQVSFTAAAGYRAIAEPGLTLDAFVGVRAWDVRASVEVPLLGVQSSPSMSFVDPLVALRIRQEVATRWSLIGYADKGGFGVGSKSTWQIVATANYRVGENFYVSVGHRYLALDYRKNGRLVDLAMHGPLVGLTWTF